VAILALGEPQLDGRRSREAGSTWALPAHRNNLLEAVVATGKPVILVVLAGRPLELKWAANHVPAILEAWSPGIEAGHAVADVLFGDVNPSGKLPASLPRAVGRSRFIMRSFPRKAGAWGPEPDAENGDEVYVAVYG
jgi:beta-glucosidase